MQTIWCRGIGLTLPLLLKVFYSHKMSTHLLKLTPDTSSTNPETHNPQYTTAVSGPKNEVFYAKWKIHKKHNLESPTPTPYDLAPGMFSRVSTCIHTLDNDPINYLWPCKHMWSLGTSLPWQYWTQTPFPGELFLLIQDFVSPRLRQTAIPVPWTSQKKSKKL